MADSIAPVTKMSHCTQIPFHQKVGKQLSGPKNSALHGTNVTGATTQGQPKHVVNTQPLEQNWDQSGEPDMTEANAKKRAFEAALKGWPWRTELVPDRVLTQAPHAMNQYNYVNVCSMPRVRQTSKIFNLGSPVELKIMNMLFSEGHLVISNLAATSQDAFHLVAFWIDRWDLSRGEFLDFDKIPKKTHLTVSEVVVISPFRIRDRVEDSFQDKIINLHKLTCAFRNFSDNFVTLHLHQIPLLTTDYLALIIPYMRKLKFLGIYACELLHLGHLEDLLKIIRTDRGMGMTKNIQLDFFPRFHVGPDPSTVPDIQNYTGSYGATWDNFDGLDTRLAIWAIVCRAMDVAKKQGVDLVSPGKALRLWLDKSPCWMVGETIQAIQLPKSKENIRKVASMVAYHHTKGNHEMFLSHRWSWNVSPIICSLCRVTYIGDFYDYEEFQSFFYLGQGLPVCLACKLRKHMEEEEDHLKLVKKHITKLWLTADDGSTISEDLGAVLEKHQLKPAVKFAKGLDKLVAQQRKERGWCAGADFEFQKTKRNTKYSPCIYRDQKDKEPSRW